MSSSTEICLADVRRAQHSISLAQQVNALSGTGNRLAHIGKKIRELVRTLESQILAEKEINQ